MTWLFADRLESLGKFVESVGIEECEKVLRRREANEVKHFLQPDKSRPRGLENFFVLRDTPSERG